MPDIVDRITAGHRPLAETLPGTDRIASITVAMDVSGRFGCFMPPYTGVEGMSLPLPFHSTGRGIFDQFMCKPDRFHWYVERIDVLPFGPDQPPFPQYQTIKRNDIKDTIPLKSVRDALNCGAPLETIRCDATDQNEKGRTQRSLTMVHNVKYRLHARIVPYDHHADPRDVIAWCEQFLRKAHRGACRQQPFLGMKDLIAECELVDPRTPTTIVDWSASLGIIPYDSFDLSRPGDQWSEIRRSYISGQVRHGTMLLPHYDSDDVLKEGH